MPTGWRPSDSIRRCRPRRYCKTSAGGTDMATVLANLEAAKASLATQVALEAAYCEAHGPKPSYSLDGESYQWVEWREACLRKIEALNRLIQAERPYWKCSRG